MTLTSPMLVSRHSTFLWRAGYANTSLQPDSFESGTGRTRRPFHRGPPVCPEEVLEAPNFVETATLPHPQKQGMPPAIQIQVVLTKQDSAEQSHIFKVLPRRAEIGPESFGIVVCRSVGTVPDIWGLAWPSFRPKSGSKSKIYGRILTSFRGPCSSAEKTPHRLLARPARPPAARAAPPAGRAGAQSVLTFFG